MHQAQRAGVKQAVVVAKYLAMWRVIGEDFERMKRCFGDEMRMVKDVNDQMLRDGVELRRWTLSFE